MNSERTDRRIYYFLFSNSKASFPVYLKSAYIFLDAKTAEKRKARNVINDGLKSACSRNCTFSGKWDRGNAFSIAAIPIFRSRDLPIL
jgi:hypothetical protein